MQARLEAALAELVFGEPTPDENSLRALLDRHDIDPADAATILEQGVARFLVYRSLVRGTLEAALEKAIPRTLARLGALREEYFDRFLAERGPRTHYLRDVTTEFLDHCAPQWTADLRVPRYLLDLGRYEALHVEIGAAPPRPSAPPDAPLDLASGLAFAEAVRLVRYEHAVHELPHDLADRSAPAERETSLFVYRSSDHLVRYLVLTPLAAAILDRLFQGEALGPSLQGAAVQRGVILDDEVLRGAARLLSDLSARGAILGPSPARLVP